MTTTDLAIIQEPAPQAVAGPSQRALLEHATVREVLMGAQDNLTNVLAVTLGVSIGSGRADLVALAGVSSAVAEAVSMGGVLYSSTRAERALDARQDREPSGGADPVGLSPAWSGTATFAAALIAGLLPLIPFLFVPLPAAVGVSMTISISALFVLGVVSGRISGTVPWRDGLRIVLVGSVAAGAAAIVGMLLPVD